MAAARKAVEPPLTASNPHVVTTQRDRRRLKCRRCGESERILGDEAMPGIDNVRSQFDYVVRYNAAVENFLHRHEHKEV